MIDFKVDNNGDLVFSNNDLILIDNELQLMQRLIIKLSMLYGEWFLNVTKGMKYFEKIFVKKPDIPTIEAIIKAAIMEEPDIISIKKFLLDFNQSTRKAIIYMTIHTDYGLVSLTKEI